MNPRPFNNLDLPWPVWRWSSFFTCQEVIVTDPHDGLDFQSFKDILGEIEIATALLAGDSARGKPWEP